MVLSCSCIVVASVPTAIFALLLSGSLGTSATSATLLISVPFPLIVIIIAQSLSTKRLLASVRGFVDRLTFVVHFNLLIICSFHFVVIDD